MSKSLEYSNFVVDTGYLTAPLGPYGVSTLKTYNINLKQVLGDIYDNYDTFSICLNSVVNYSIVSSYNTLDTSVLSLGNNSVVKVGMTGLNWMSSTLNGTKSTLCLFPNGFIVGGNSTANDGGYGTASFKNPNCIMFKKPPQPNITITVGLYTVRKNLPIICGNSQGISAHQANYNFSIYGIEEE